MKCKVPVLLLIALSSLSPALSQGTESVKEQNTVQLEPGDVNHSAHGVDDGRNATNKIKVSYEKLSNIPFESSQSSPVVQHQTEKGTVVCRDPQAEFDETALRASPIRKLMKEHMLVDIIVNKRLLNKGKADVDFLLGVPQDLRGVSRYELFPPRRVCGNAPQLYLEAVYNEDSKLVRYRSRYYEDGGSLSSIDSQWIE